MMDGNKGYDEDMIALFENFADFDPDEDDDEVVYDENNYEYEAESEDENMSAFDKVIGYSAEKKELRHIADVLKNGESYAKLGVSAPRGLLLHGEPGVGKTLMATALVKESGRKEFLCRKDKPNGDFVKAIKATFKKAAEAAPSIVFLDDMDKFANGDENHRDAEEYVTVQSCIDEVKGKDVFVLATANTLRVLPHSLMRAGRFDRIIRIRTPHGSDAVKIVRHYLDRKKCVGDMDAETVARIMDGRSCAELETVINEAGLFAGYERAECITMDHFLAACLKTVFNVNSSDDYDDYDDDDCDGENRYPDLDDAGAILSQIVYHEAGHAVISEVLCPGSVTLVSARGGKGRGGFTSYYNDNTVSPLRWQQSRALAALGGMAALEQKYGIEDIGNSEDLDQAHRILMDLVSENAICGFRFLDSPYRNSGDLTSDQEKVVVSELERYYRRTKQLLSLNSAFLEKVAAALAEKELLTAQDIRAIREECTVLRVAV